MRLSVGLLNSEKEYAVIAQTFDGDDHRFLTISLSVYLIYFLVCERSVTAQPPHSSMRPCERCLVVASPLQFATPVRAFNHYRQRECRQPSTRQDGSKRQGSSGRAV